MIIHKSKQAIDITNIGKIIPSIHYEEFGLTDIETSIIESHGPWSEVARWSNRATQQCESCGIHISVVLKHDLFMLFNVYEYGEDINPDIEHCKG